MWLQRYEKDRKKCRCGIIKNMWRFDNSTVYVVSASQRAFQQENIDEEIFQFKTSTTFLLATLLSSSKVITGLITIVCEATNYRKLSVDIRSLPTISRFML